MDALVVVVASVAAPLAALGPQLTPCWAALMRLVVPAAASSAALDLQQAPAGVALACRQWHLGHQLVPPGTAPMVL